MIEPVDHPNESPATDVLARLGGDGWSAFVKVVRSFRHWPRWSSLPEDVRALLGEESMWRREVDLYTSGLADALPPGMRLPVLHGVVELGDDRVMLVLEDVDVDPSPWDGARYARAARLLARLHARMTAAPDLPRRSAQRPAELIDAMYTTRLRPVTLPILADDATWRHPLLARSTELRADLVELARRLPALVALAARLPQLQGHGDATPHNLLVPRAEPDTFVVIDWAMASLAPVGDDLGQLLVGHAHDGVLAAAELPAIHDLLVQAYLSGLADEHLAVDAHAVVAGMDAGLAVRSAFTALPLERLGDPVTDELAAAFDARLQLTRYLVDVGLRIDTAERLSAADAA